MAKVDPQEIVRFLNERWSGLKVCPVCQNNNWNIPDKLVEVREYSPGKLVIGSPVYPLIPLTCTVCGNTILFNAIVAGILEKPKPDTPEESEASKREGEQK